MIRHLLGFPLNSYAFKSASSIAREQGEKLLLMSPEPPGYTTTHVVALINRPYEEIYKGLRNLVQERWGILEEFNNSHNPIPDPPERIVRDDLDWPVLGEGLSRLAAHPTSTEEYQLISQPYNKVASINGHSQVVIRVTNAAGLLGSDAAILQVTRTDRSREWARGSFHGVVPLPYKEMRTDLGLVTSTEISLIEQLKKLHTGIQIRYFTTPTGPLYSEDAPVLLEKMQDALKTFPKEK